MPTVWEKLCLLIIHLNNYFIELNTMYKVRSVSLRNYLARRRPSAHDHQSFIRPICHLLSLQRLTSPHSALAVCRLPFLQRRLVQAGAPACRRVSAASPDDLGTHPLVREPCSCRCCRIVESSSHKIKYFSYFPYGHFLKLGRGLYSS